MGLIFWVAVVGDSLVLSEELLRLPNMESSVSNGVVQEVRKIRYEGFTHGWWVLAYLVSSSLVIWMHVVIKFTVIRNITTIHI